MPIEPNDPDAQLPQAQAQPQPQPQKQTPPEALLQIDLRKLAKWPSPAPRPEILLATIRKLAKERCIGFLSHAEQRLAQRGFDIFDVYMALEKTGQINGAIEAGKNEGEWKVKVVDIPDGTSRKMGVVTILVKEQRLLIKTVEWEDR